MKKMKLKRLEKNFTLKKLGELIGVQANTMQQYETGKRKTSIEVLKKLAQIYDCKIDDLID